MKIKLIWKAIIDKLRSDTGIGSLVALSGHTVEDQRIKIKLSPFTSSYPVIAISAGRIVPAVESGPTALNEAVFTITCISTDLEVTSDIVSRLKTLLDADDKENKSNYLDFTNSDICCKHTKYMSCSDIVINEDLNVYSQLVFMRVVWSEH